MATRLARLTDTDSRAEAIATLRGIAFTEGADNADVLAARAMLDDSSSTERSAHPR